MEEKRRKKWEKIYKVLDDAHLAGLKLLAKEMKKWEMDSKELRANINLFKQEKWEKVVEEQDPIEEMDSLKEKLRQIKNT